MSQLRVTLERRALVALMFLAGVSALLGGVILAMDALGAMRSPVVMSLVFALGFLARVGVLAATANYVATSPRRGLARTGFGLMLGLVVCNHLLSLLVGFIPEDARVDAFTTFHVAFRVLTALAVACVLTAIALSSRGSARTIGLALAVLALALPVADVAFGGELRESAWGIVAAVLMDLVPIAAYLVRWQILGKATSPAHADAEPVTSRAAGREDWQVAASGAGILRTAVILQIAIVAGLFVLGLATSLGGGGASGLAVIVMILGILGAVAVVVLYVVGLGRLGQIPTLSEARATVSAAFQLTLVNCFLGLLLVVIAAIAIVRPQLVDEPQWLLRDCQESMAVYGLVASIALLVALRRVGIRLAAPRLRAMAVTTMVLQLAGYVPTVALDLLHGRWSDADSSPGVNIALGLAGLGLGIAAWTCLLVALRELATTLSGSALADAFRAP